MTASLPLLPFIVFIVGAWLILLRCGWCLLRTWRDNEPPTHHPLHFHHWRIESRSGLTVLRRCRCGASRRGSLL